MPGFEKAKSNLGTGKNLYHRGHWGFTEGTGKPRGLSSSFEYS
jgi:hypothetical protein